MKNDIAILFATMTGNAEACAEELAELLRLAGHDCRLENLAEYPASRLAEETIALLLVSTWGEGDPPDDAVDFAEGLSELGENSLTGLRFSVFALGDRAYDEFCGFGLACDAQLARAGAGRLLDCECCDLDHEEKLPGWAKAILSRLNRETAGAAS